MIAQPLLRRVVMVLCACGFSIPFLRGALSDALLARGDSALAVGSLNAAWRYYQRAETLGGTRTALRRIVTLALLSNDRSILHRALESMKQLKATRASASLIFDRALLEWRAHRLAAAEHDARIASHFTNSIAPLLFAGILARRRGAIQIAHLDFARAHRLSPQDPRPLYQLRKEGF